MQRLVIAVAVAFGVSCGEPNTVHSSDVRETTNNTSGGDRKVCRFEIERPPAALRLFSLTTEGGGRTCFDGEKVVLIIPQTASGCLHLNDGEYDNVRVVSQLDAEEEYVRCSALSLDSVADSNPGLVFTRSNDSLEVNEAFMDFTLDVAALISNDGLMATYFSPGGDETCIESPNVERVKAHIVESQIVDPSHVQTSVRVEGCYRSERP